MKRSGRLVVEANCVMQSEDVLLANTGTIDHRFEPGEDLALRVGILDDRLDDQVAAGQLLQAVGRSGWTACGPVAPPILPAFEPGVEERLDAPDSRAKGRSIDLAHDGAVAGLRRNLRNTGAHESAPDDADSPICHA